MKQISAPDRTATDTGDRGAAGAGESPLVSAQAWLAAFGQVLSVADTDAIARLFVEKCYWRDLLTFTWNIKTVEGREAIRDMLAVTLDRVKPSAWAIAGDPMLVDGVIEAWFTFETAVAWGEGVLRLREGRCWTLFTAMRDLKGYEERRGPTRPLGAERGASRERRTWLEERRREEAELGHAVQPYCLVVGGGQGGIMLGARFRQLGVTALVIDQNKRPGDSWRNRYRTLVLHDPVWYDHLPYIPFPENWPVFTPKDKMGDWLEMYTRVMEISYWNATRCLGAAYDDDAKSWTVEVDRAGERLTLHPKHLIFATGTYGPPRRLTLPGAEVFRGDLLHSSEYDSGEGFRGKRVAVIGTGSSGHDVAVDLWESGAAVTMIQRSPTTVVKSSTLMDMAFETYSQAAAARGMTAERADLLLASIPLALLPAGQRALYDAIKKRDATYYEQLRAAGLAIDFGDDETGILMKAYRTGGGYYIDVGAGQLIIDGEIKVRSGVSVERLTETGLLLSDGTELGADAVVACTGYHNASETVARITSREVADKIGPIRGLGSGVRGDPGPWLGDPRNLWKPTAQEALWFHGGNLALSRFYSRYLALQIKARMEGIDTPSFGGTSAHPAT